MREKVDGKDVFTLREVLDYQRLRDGTGRPAGGQTLASLRPRIFVEKFGEADED